MWTIDTRCSQCKHKPDCKDRTAILTTLSPLSNTLNTDAQHVDGTGDGILIVACKDFEV